MSDDERHLVATGEVLADAKPLVERLLALSITRPSVDVIVMDRSDAIPRYRRLATAAANFELHIPSSQVAAFATALAPLITDPNRRWPELGVDDGKGGRWLSVHGDEPEALDVLRTLPAVPVEFSLRDLDDVDWDLVDPSLPASVEWSTHWPAMGDLGPHGKHAGVCLLSNTDAYWDLTPGDQGYRLYVSTETGGAGRAEQLLRRARSGPAPAG